MNARDRFGPNLRRTREQRGISLDRIAAETNVDREMWAGLERNDFSRWPSGIFARAFVREYARLIGVDPEHAVDEFCRWFPQGDRRRDQIIRAEAELLGVPSEWTDDLAPVRERRGREAPVPPDQLTRDGYRARRSRLVAAGIDVLIAGAGGALLARAASAPVWPVVGATALAYHAAGLVFFGGTCGSALVDAWLRHASAADLRRLPHAAFPRLRRGATATRS